MANINKLDAATMAAKWANRTKNAIPETVAGINAVDESPGMKAAAKKDLYLQRIIEKADVWARNVSAMPLSTWKQITSTKVQQRMAQGVEAGLPNFQKFSTWQINTLKGVLSTINSMPTNSLEDNIAKASAYMRAMAAQSYNAQK